MTPDRVTRLLAKAEADGWTPDPRLREYTAWLIAQIEAELSAESAGDRLDSWIGNLDPLKEPASPHSKATDDLLKRLDKLTQRVGPSGIVSVSLKQVKETVRQWIADQEGKR